MQPVVALDAQTLRADICAGLRKHVLGQDQAMDLLSQQVCECECAQSGVHTVCLSGPPGVGKTEAATQLRDLLPPKWACFYVDACLRSQCTALEDLKRLLTQNTHLCVVVDDVDKADCRFLVALQRLLQRYPHRHVLLLFTASWATEALAQELPLMEARLAVREAMQQQLSEEEIAFLGTIIPFYGPFVMQDE